MFKKKPGNKQGDASEIWKRLDQLEGELERLEELEKGLAKNELLLSRKITDMNAFEEKLKELVSKQELRKLRDELKKIEEHEELLSENAKFMNEMLGEMSKIKESHKLTRSKVMAREHVKKTECEEKFKGIKDALEQVNQIQKTHKKKAEHSDLKSLKQELHDRMSQIEYQNKLLIEYLKKVDEELQKRIS